MRIILAFLLVMGLVVACGSDGGPVSGDAGTDAKKADGGLDAPYGDAADLDSADTSYVPATCDPNNDAGDTCPGATKCCPVGSSGPDGGPTYECVFLKPPNDTCPTPTPGG